MSGQRRPRSASEPVDAAHAARHCLYSLLGAVCAFPLDNARHGPHRQSLERWLRAARVTQRTGDERERFIDHEELLDMLRERERVGADDGDARRAPMSVGIERLASGETEIELRNVRHQTHVRIRLPERG